MAQFTPLAMATIPFAIDVHDGERHVTRFPPCAGS
jgi:hypothetical protein